MVDKDRGETWKNKCCNFMNIGIGDSFTYKRNHWMVIDVKNEKFICKNKGNGAVVECKRVD